jgi:succinate dehydrogenase hydrophobic anchor subunit
MDSIKKNILDLHYNTYLQYFNTIVIILCTYIIGIIIAGLTKQIDIHNASQVLAVTTISVLVILSFLIMLLYLQKKLQRIIKDINSLSQSIKTCS